MHDFEVKNFVSSNKRIELSDIQVVLIMAREIFETCSVDSFTKWTHKTVVGKSWMVKLLKIDTEDQNELACYTID